MRHRAIGNFVSSVVIAVLGFAFAFLLFVASLKIYQYAYEMHEAASLMNTDGTEFRQLQLLTVIVALCAGIPFVITVFTAILHGQKSHHANELGYVHPDDVIPFRTCGKYGFYVSFDPEGRNGIRISDPLCSDLCLWSRSAHSFDITHCADSKCDT